MSIFSSFVKI